jgi:hypothetical protein
MHGALAELPARLFCLMVGDHYYDDPVPDCELSEDGTLLVPVSRAFLTYGSAVNYKHSVEPFMDSALQVREVSLASMFIDAKGLCRLIVSDCFEHGDVVDLEVLWDPVATIH